MESYKCRKTLFYKGIVLCLSFGLMTSAVAKNELSADKVAKLETAAVKKGGEAQYKLGEMYAEGDGVPQDYKKAFEWYSKAANLNDAQAQYKLGEMYAEGNGVPQDYEKAFEWYSKAEKNNGDKYSYKTQYPKYKPGTQSIVSAPTVILIITKGPKVVYDWYPVAQATIGEMYYQGKGVKKDYSKAFAYYRLSAMSVVSRAQTVGKKNKVVLDLISKTTPLDFSASTTKEQKAKATNWFKNLCEADNDQSCKIQLVMSTFSQPDDIINNVDSSDSGIKTEVTS